MAEAAETTVTEKTDGEIAGDALAEKLQKSERAAAIERAARAEAERRGAASAADAARYRDIAERAQGGAVTSTITGLEQERDRLKADHAQALSDGDFTKASDIQFRMAECATKLTNATAWKAQQDAGKVDGKTSQGSGGGNGFDKEAFIASKSPSSAAWLRNHDEYFTDQKIQAKVTGAHNLAIGNGLTVDTPEYFDFLETTAGLRGDTGGGQTETTTEDLPITRKNTVPRAGEQRRPAMAAPPSRDGGTALPKLRAGDIHISAEMKRAAEICGVSPEEYRTDYIRLVGEGKISDHLGIYRR